MKSGPAPEVGRPSPTGAVRRLRASGNFGAPDPWGDLSHGHTIMFDLGLERRVDCALHPTRTTGPDAADAAFAPEALLR